MPKKKRQQQSRPKPKPKPKAKTKAQQASAKKPTRIGAKRRSKNASLIDAAVAQMAAVGKAAADDVTRLRGSSAIVQPRRVAGGKGKGTRRNPIVHRITRRGGGSR